MNDIREMENMDLNETKAETIEVPIKNRKVPTNEVLRVKKDTDVNALSIAIYGCMQDFNKCVLRCVGPMPTWQASKACALAAGHLATLGRRIKTRLGFIEPRPVIGDIARTAIEISVNWDE